MFYDKCHEMIYLISVKRYLDEGLNQEKRL